MINETFLSQQMHDIVVLFEMKFVNKIRISSRIPDS